MKRETGKWVRKAEEDIKVARDLAARKPPPRNAASFHCQQAAEKYLKALLQNLGAAVPKTHDLRNLLDLLVPHDGTLEKLRRSATSLTRYAVDYRYPGGIRNHPTDESSPAQRRARSGCNPHTPGTPTVADLLRADCESRLRPGLSWRTSRPQAAFVTCSMRQMPATPESMADPSLAAAQPFWHNE